MIIFCWLFGHDMDYEVWFPMKPFCKNCGKGLGNKK